MSASDPRHVDDDGTFQMMVSASLSLAVEGLQAAREASNDRERVWLLTETLERLERLLRVGDIVWLNEQFDRAAVLS